VATSLKLSAFVLAAIPIIVLPLFAAGRFAVKASATKDCMTRTADRLSVAKGGRPPRERVLGAARALPHRPLSRGRLRRL
jgi:hypothetical protein